jgi:hypothetical protein
VEWNSCTTNDISRRVKFAFLTGTLNCLVFTTYVLVILCVTSVQDWYHDVERRCCHSLLFQDSRRRFIVQSLKMSCVVPRCSIFALPEALTTLVSTLSIMTTS